MADKKGSGPKPHDPNDSVCKVNASEEILEKMRRRRAQMMVHSYIYYFMSTNVVSDQTWDKWALELSEMQEKYGYEIGYYDDVFEDFDGTTGMYLPRNEHVVNAAHNVLVADDIFEDENEK